MLMSKIVAKSRYANDIEGYCKRANNVWHLDVKISVKKIEIFNEEHAKVKIKKAYLTNSIEGILELNGRHKKKIARLIEKTILEENFRDLCERRIDEIVFGCMEKIVPCLGIDDEEIDSFLNGNVKHKIELSSNVRKTLEFEDWYVASRDYFADKGQVMYYIKDENGELGIPLIVSGDRVFVSEKIYKHFEGILDRFKLTKGE